MTAAHRAGWIAKANQLNSLDVGCTWFTRQTLRYLYARVSPGALPLDVVIAKRDNCNMQTSSILQAHRQNIGKKYMTPLL
jgi:hypothetical protein